MDARTPRAAVIYTTAVFKKKYAGFAFGNDVSGQRDPVPRRKAVFYVLQNAPPIFYHEWIAALLIRKKGVRFTAVTISAILTWAPGRLRGMQEPDILIKPAVEVLEPGNIFRHAHAGIIAQGMPRRVNPFPAVSRVRRVYLSSGILCNGHTQVDVLGLRNN